MLLPQNLIAQFTLLPDDLQKEALDFIGYLLQKYQQQISTEKKPKFNRTAGTMPNLIAFMADDFDAPLDDFKDYM